MLCEDYNRACLHCIQVNSTDFWSPWAHGKLHKPTSVCRTADAAGAINEFDREERSACGRMEKGQGQLGYLQLNEDGAVLSSAGELQNDERTANVIMSMLTLCQHNDLFAGSAEDTFKRMTLTYDMHAYVVCLSNRKIHVIKKHYEVQPSSAAAASC